MTFYALKHKEHGLLGVMVSSNGDGDFCSDYSVKFTPDEENPWVTNNKGNVMWLHENRVAWYNSDMETPENPYKKDELEIIEMEIG